MNIGKGRYYQVAIGAVFLLFGILAVNVPGVSAKEAILVVPDAVLGNVVGTQEVLSSLQTEVGKQANFEMSVFEYNPDEDLEVVLGKMAQKVNDLKIVHVSTAQSPPTHNDSLDVSRSLT